jgi:hypothetical protein
MSQDIFNDIDPNTTSGVQLATLLNAFKDAFASGLIGSARPVNLQEGGFWVDESLLISNGYYIFQFYNGSSDIELFRINNVTESIIFAPNDSQVEIVKQSDDSIGPKLKFQKKRLAPNEQTDPGDILGDVDFEAFDDSNVSYVSARIRVISNDATTSSEQGSDMHIFITAQDTNTLAEAVRVAGNGRVSIGGVTPAKKLHVYGQDSNTAALVEQQENSTTPARVILRKKRLAGAGQVLNNDLIGEQTFESTDDTGATQEVAKISLKATQNHTAANQGTELSISLKNQNSNTYTEALKLSNGEATIFGLKQNDTELNANLLDDTLTRQLFQIDGTVYGAFTAEVYLTGRDNAPSHRQQKIIIDGIYDFNNTTWRVEQSHQIMFGVDKVVDLALVNAATLTVNYVNKFLAANFTDGKIYTKIRRHPR